MSKTITQTVTFPGATAGDLYALYMNSKKHGQVTGGPAEIGKKAGDAWTAFGKAISGKHLLVQRNKMIVQTWRAKSWGRATPDSVLVLTFADQEGGASVQVVHALVPDEALAEVKKGWNDLYWKRWKAHLKSAAK
jgi:uncharacterized protein YndB with AHSA1/START domain